MDLQDVQNQAINLFLSADAKPRLKWTPQLHQRFVDSVAQLGGEEKATPKSLMKEMGIPGLTLYHLKSHLQKYRHGKNQATDSCKNSKQEDFEDIGDGAGEQTSNSISINMQMQMEVQREIREQIEVQKHLQLRIEAQGKYLQKVLKKAQETFAAYSSSSIMVNCGYSSPSRSDLTESRVSTIDNLESSLTSSETSDANEIIRTPIELELLDRPLMTHSSTRVLSKKRKGSSISEGNSKAANKRLSTYKENMRSKPNEIGYAYGSVDLNIKYQEDQNLGSKPQ